jgi:hypothetical protein
VGHLFSGTNVYSLRQGQMKADNLKRLVSWISGIFLVALLVAPVLSICLVMVGLGIYSFSGNQEVALWLCGIALSTSLFLAPIALRVFSKSPLRALGHDRLQGAWSLVMHPMSNSFFEQEDGHPRKKDQRRHLRYRVALLPGTFVNEHICGLVRVGNISTRGCGVECQAPVSIADFGQLLLDLPGCSAPLKISEAVVRWVKGKECGMEFIHINPADQELLSNFIGQLDVGAAIPTE